MNFYNVVFESSYGRLSQMPVSDMPEIAFAGRSNVGKSSMINKLFNRKALARVSGMPGKTVTINFFRVGDIRFADLPGYGYAKVAKTEKERWARLMEGYFQSDRNIQLVCQLVDMRHPPTRDDLVMMNFLIESETPFIVILTKADKLSTRQRQERMTALMQEIPYAEQITLVQFSSETGMGVEEVREIIEQVVLENALETAEETAQEQQPDDGSAEECL